MKDAPTRQEVTEFFSLFGMDIEATLANVADRAKAFEAAKARVKQAYKERALAEHPDKGGDEEAFKLLTNAYSCIQNMVLTVPAPRPQPAPAGWVRVTVFTDGFTNTSTTTGAGSW